MNEPQQMICNGTVKTGRCPGTLLMVSSVKNFHKDVEEIRYIYKCSACMTETKLEKDDLP